MIKSRLCIKTGGKPNEIMDVAESHIRLPMINNAINCRGMWPASGVGASERSSAVSVPGRRVCCVRRAAFSSDFDKLASSNPLVRYISAMRPDNFSEMHLRLIALCDCPRSRVRGAGR